MNCIYNNNTNAAVLFVHGIQGSPKQFEWMIESLPSDVDAINVLLPGHGSDVRNFRKIHMSTWKEYICELTDRLNEKYDYVFYVGHSMGCLLGIDALMKKRRCYRAMILMA